jgi:phosphopantetheinyl transferase
VITTNPPAQPISVPWDVPLTGIVADETIVCRRVQWHAADDPSFSAGRGNTLANHMLSPVERSAWNRMEALPKRRSEWLLGRIVAKEAVLELLRDCAGLSLAPEAIEIIADERGRPIVRGAWIAQLGAPPAVTISHTGGVAIAMAVLDSALSIGIDIELCRARRRRFEMAAFTSDERQLVAGLPDGRRDEWHLRLWCAKEATGKALGCGLIDGPLALEVTAVHVDNGTVHLTANASFAGAVRVRSGRSIVAHTARAADCVCAAVLLRGGPRQSSFTATRAEFDSGL